MIHRNRQRILATIAAAIVAAVATGLLPTVVDAQSAPVNWANQPGPACLRVYKSARPYLDGITFDWYGDTFPSWRDLSPHWERLYIGHHPGTDPWILDDSMLPDYATLIWPVSAYGLILTSWGNGDLEIHQLRPGEALPDTCGRTRYLLPLTGR